MTKYQQLVQLTEILLFHYINLQPYTWKAIIFFLKIYQLGMLEHCCSRVGQVKLEKFSYTNSCQYNKLQASEQDRQTIYVDYLKSMMKVK